MTSISAIGLKVCGMRDAANILEVAALLPDYMGFIFYSGSKRAVSSDFSIPAGFPSAIKKVGVFVNEDVTTITKLVEVHSLDFVQLHGEEGVDECAFLKSNGIGVIKVLSINDTVDFSILKPYRSSVDYFLFDTKGSVYGGTGTVFDWKVLRKYDQEVPFFLSGGLSPENISDVSRLAGMNIHAVDVNSGVEISPGIKDRDRIRKVQKGRIALDLQK